MAFADLVKGLVSPKQFKQLLQSSIVLGSVIIAVLGVALSYGGNIAPWAGRFYSLWDTSYARKHIPIIASVSEHQPTAWPSFIFDLQILMFLFPAGVYLCFRELRDEHVFLILYSVTASYFAGVMVRLYSFFPSFFLTNKLLKDVDLDTYCLCCLWCCCVHVD